VARFGLAEATQCFAFQLVYPALKFRIGRQSVVEIFSIPLDCRASCFGTFQQERITEISVPAFARSTDIYIVSGATNVYCFCHFVFFIKLMPADLQVGISILCRLGNDVFSRCKVFGKNTTPPVAERSRSGVEIFPETRRA
jgi:hypothetical protein